jgi:hypothetical protein
VTDARTFPRGGADFTGDDHDAVVDAVVEHASTQHWDSLDRDVVLAHPDGAHPFERDR